MKTKDKEKAMQEALKIVNNHLADYDTLPETIVKNITIAVQDEIMRRGCDMDLYLLGVGLGDKSLLPTCNKFKISDFVDSFFVWSESIKGHNYWRGVYDAHHHNC